MTTTERGPAAKGRRTRETILSAAVDVASAEGLEALTIGRLAAALEMSKSGLFAHFGSKEELQLATVEAAREIFIDEVIRPAFDGTAGLERLWRLLDVWLSYAERGVFRGGCFFANASAEFDSRPGPIRDRIAAIMTEWLAGIERTVAEAQRAGHLDASADARQLAFELNALAMGANWGFQLHGDSGAFLLARRAMRDRIGSLSTDAAPPLPAVENAEEGR